MLYYIFIGIGGTAYVTANKEFSTERPDGVYKSLGSAISAVQRSDYMLQLDRKLLDENKCAGGFSFAGDDYYTYTADLV